MKRNRALLLCTIIVASVLVLAGCASSGVSSSSGALASSGASAESAASASSAAPADAVSPKPSAASSVPLAASSLEDGEYQVDVSLEGGSGRAYIESPARVVVDEGAAKLIVVWSSENYDLMIVDGTEYYPVPRPGNSTFELPIANVVDDLPVQAETTAMSQPHLIDYVIHFESATLRQTA